MQLAWDQVSSGLDRREAVFELHASGGLEAWRRQLASWFGSYNELANGVQEFIQVDIPPLDLSSLQEVPPPPLECLNRRRDRKRRRQRVPRGWAIIDKVALFIDEREGEVLDCMDELRSRHPDPLCLIAVSWYQPQRRN